MIPQNNLGNEQPQQSRTDNSRKENIQMLLSYIANITHQPFDNNWNSNNTVNWNRKKYELIYTEHAHRLRWTFEPICEQNAKFPLK